MPSISLNPKQKMFHDHRAFDEKGEPVLSWCYYGGAMGGGKSHAIGASALLKAIEEPGARIAVVRLKETDLVNTTMKVFLDKVCQPAGELWNWCGIEWNKSTNVFKINRGSRPGIPASEIHFFGLTSSGGSSTDSFSKLLSAEFTHVYIDEAYEVPDSVVEVLPTRLRLKREGSVKYSYAIKVCSNPAPNWIYEWFIEKPIKNSKFIPAFYTDNINNLVSGYADSFDRMTPAMQKRFRDGSHNCFDGQVWPGGVQPHHLLEDVYTQDLDPEVWRHTQSVDPGLNDPTASLWAIYHIASDLLIVCREYEVDEADVSEHASRFKITESALGFRGHIERVIDPAAGQRSLASTDMSSNVLRLFKRHGLYYKRANNSLEMKTISMNERLQISYKRPHPITGVLGCPGIMFVEEHTKKTRKAISGMMWEETKSERPKWRNVNKHLVDAATYMTNHFSRTARREKDEETDGIFE